jgi:hypothetical protein
LAAILESTTIQHLAGNSPNLKMGWGCERCGVTPALGGK